EGRERENVSSWFGQVSPTRYPVLTPHRGCPTPLADGPYARMEGAGFQEIVITRDHKRSIGFMSREEISLVFSAYRARFLALKDERCVEYILIFHNNGPAAGATVPHPHSQILALPITPADVSRSLAGSERYFEKYKKCVHCTGIKKELRDGARIIYKNKSFVSLCPYASRASFEIRIFPRRHDPYFESMEEGEFGEFVDAVEATFRKLKEALNDPDYNFFIHTAPVSGKKFANYHWHMEILPRTATYGGVELGTGMEIIKMPPEEAARMLRKAR
ncbi:MAG: DUF4931 domain-containing protein, partial [Patescibacteria group bacterium]